MAVDITISKISESYIHLACSPSILRELSDRFTFDVPGAKFSPAYRNKYWDGKIRLLDSRKQSLFSGLVQSVVDFAAEHDYTVTDDTGLSVSIDFPLEKAKDFATALNLPVVPRDYQLHAFATAVRNRRAVLVSPTGSGKSLIAYMITRFYNKKTLIVVPTVSLVMQLVKDFQSYGYDEPIHGVMAGVEKNTESDITISTWQSVFREDAEFFEQFEVIIGDEAHLFKAKSLISIMTKMNTTKYRFGMTGTLDGAEVHELVLTGLFGVVEKVIDTSSLMQQGSLAQLKIKILVLKHDAESCKLLQQTPTYQDELQFIVASNERNMFIRNLANSLRGNTLVLFAYVEKHGKILHSLIKDQCNHDNVFFVAGEVEAEDRENIRAIAEQTDNAIIVASYGVFSQGINIKRLHNIIFASPTKSRIRTLQSIGRGLRRGDDKDECRLFDIADDLTYRNKKNYTLKHLIERVKMYNTESFPYELHNIELKRG